MVNKPKQPCSIYNLFFQLERECLLHEYIPNRSQCILRDIVICRNSGQNVCESRDIDQRPLRYRHLTLPDNWFKSGRSNRKHRKTNLPFGFLQLNKIISERWESVDEETKVYLKEIASSEWKIYRENQKKYLEHNMTMTKECKVKSTKSDMNRMDSGAIKRMMHSYAPCEINSDVDHALSLTKNHNNSSYNAKFNCGCKIPHHYQKLQESWYDPHSATSETTFLPVNNTDSATNNLDPIPIRCFSTPQVHQGHVMKNPKFNAQAENNNSTTTSIRQYSSMPIIHRQNYPLTPLSCHRNGTDGGNNLNADFQYQTLRQCHQAGSRLIANFNTNPLESLTQSNHRSPQKIFSFAEEFDTIQSFLQVVSERKQRQNTQIQIEDLRQTQELVQFQAHAQNQSNPMGCRQFSHGNDQNQKSLTIQSYRTENTSNFQDTWADLSTSTPSNFSHDLQNASLPQNNGSNFWCRQATNSACNHDEAKVNPATWVGGDRSVALAPEETNIEGTDFPAASFHPVDDSLAFFPHGGPCDI